MEEDRKKMNEKKKKISSIPAKKSPAKKTKRQSKKAPKKVVKEALKKRQEEHHDGCRVSDKNKSSGKLMDSVEETNSDKKTRVPKKKIVSPDKMEIVKKYKEKVKCYEHDETHS